MEHSRQIVITGVEGAGRRFFASLYFPTAKPTEKQVRLSAKAEEIIIVAVLDCRHLQNQAEANMLKAVTRAVNRWQSKNVRVLLVLGQIDLVCTHRQNRNWIEKVMSEYKHCLVSLKTREKKIVAHSNLAVNRIRQVLVDEIDADDLDDLNYLLFKVGHRLPKSVSVDNVKMYIGKHLKSIQMLTGEYYINQFLTKTVRARARREK